MGTTAKLYSLTFSDSKTYLFATLFACGNLALPQLCHLLPVGGPTLLPIYFFTLIAAYKYGLTVGLLTAILSPLSNHLLFGMPPAGMVPVILAKSVLLATAAAIVARRVKAVSLLALLAMIPAYQLVGAMFEWAFTGDFMRAVQNLRTGIPGMLIQWFGGYLVLKSIEKR